MSLLHILLYSYLITLLLEGVSGLLWGVRNPAEILSLVCINTLTNPPVVLFTYLLRICLPVWKAQMCLLVLEVLVIGIEAVFYRTFLSRVRYPVLFSIQTNLLSFIGGALIFHVIF